MLKLYFILASMALLLGSATPPPLPSRQLSPAPLPSAVLAVALQVQEAPVIAVEEPAIAPDEAPEPAPPDPPEEVPAPDSIPPTAGVRVVVSIPLQKAYVFDDGGLLWTAPVSTGKDGHETPTGTFPILQKKVHHRSNKYDDAPMPYMQRLTWYGIAIHAGRVPGYPASHGCIRLPRSFARKLYDLTGYGTLVTITNERPRSAEEALLIA